MGFTLYSSLSLIISFALVVQWIEQIRPKDKMGVRFPPRAQN